MQILQSLACCCLHVILAAGSIMVSGIDCLSFMLYIIHLCKMLHVLVESKLSGSCSLLGGNCAVAVSALQPGNPPRTQPNCLLLHAKKLDANSVHCNPFIGKHSAANM